MLNMWPTDIIARIEGGLGNQLFQYAAARTLADSLGCDLMLDLRGLEANGDRPYMLQGYRIRATLASDELLQALPLARSTRWGRMRSRIAQTVPSLFSFPVFWPQSFAYDRRFERISRPVFLVGYWQSEKYFHWNRNRILADLQLMAVDVVNLPLCEQIRNCNSVALHVRRGDYVSNAPAAAYHGLCDLSYYQIAIANLYMYEPDIHVFVFSDDLAWVKANLKLNVPLYFVEGDSGQQAYIDLELMSHCRHHVIANSSFSWWGAWRGNAPDQRVYAPAQWFSDPETDTSDVVPIRWNRQD